MKPYPSRKNGIRLVMMISIVVILLVPLSSTFADREIRHTAGHNITLVRNADMPCVEDPSPVFDYTITRDLTVIVDHQDENGHEHIVDARTGHFSAVPRFNPELPTYEGRETQVFLFQEPEGENTLAVTQVIRTKVRGSDGSEIDFMFHRKIQLVNEQNDVIVSEEKFVCR